MLFKYGPGAYLTKNILQDYLMVKDHKPSPESLKKKLKK